MSISFPHWCPITIEDPVSFAYPAFLPLPCSLTSPSLSVLSTFLLLPGNLVLFLSFSGNFFPKDHLTKTKGVLAEVILYVSVICISEVISTVYHTSIFKRFSLVFKKYFILIFLPFLTLLFSFLIFPHHHIHVDIYSRISLGIPAYPTHFLIDLRNPQNINCRWS